MIKEYQIAVIYTIKANTYEEALSIVEQGTLTNDQAAVVYDYESDNEGQRVVYLPGIDDTTGPDADDFVPFDRASRRLRNADDVAVNAADALSHDALNEAAKNGAELGTCDEDD